MSLGRHAKGRARLSKNPLQVAATRRLALTVVRTNLRDRSQAHARNQRPEVRGPPQSRAHRPVGPCYHTHVGLACVRVCCIPTETFASATGISHNLLVLGYLPDKRLSSADSITSTQSHPDERPADALRHAGDAATVRPAFASESTSMPNVDRQTQYKRPVHEAWGTLAPGGFWKTEVYCDPDHSVPHPRECATLIATFSIHQRIPKTSATYAFGSHTRFQVDDACKE